MIFKQIFKPIFKPLFKSNFLPENFPPDFKSLISWTFTKLLEATYSPDKVTASTENAVLVESYCARFNASYFVKPYHEGQQALDKDWYHEFYARTDSLSQSGFIFANIQADTARGLGICQGRPYSYTANADLGIYFSDTVTPSTSRYVYWSNIFGNTYTSYHIKIGVTAGVFFLEVDGVDKGAATVEYTAGSFPQDNSPNGYYFGKWARSTPPKYWYGRLANAKHYVNGVLQHHFPLQGSLLDISGKGNHATNYGANLHGVQDKFHYNLFNGFDCYSLDSAPTDKTKYIFVPYVAGVPIVTSLAGYTKIGSYPANLKYHNNAETKIVVGTTGVRNATGWVALASFKDAAGNEYTPAEADPNEIFIRHTTSPTGYCKAFSLRDSDAVQLGDYIAFDKSNATYNKNLLWYAVAPTLKGSVALHKFIGKTDFMVFDDGYFYDENGFVITYNL